MTENWIIKESTDNQRIINKKNRFTEEDDKKLISLVRKFPKNWKKISQIMNRNKRACRERYQHYLMPKHSTWHWTTEEKLQLIYVKGKLNYSWDAINKIFPSRGPKTIKNQWYYLKKKISVQILIEQMKNIKPKYHKPNTKSIDKENFVDFVDIFDCSDLEFILHSHE